MSTYTSAGAPISRFTTLIDEQAYKFSIAIDPLFTALDEEEPVVPATMVPPIREAIAGMRAVLEEAEKTLDALEK